MASYPFWPAIIVEKKDQKYSVLFWHYKAPQRRFTVQSADVAIDRIVPYANKEDVIRLNNKKDPALNAECRLADEIKGMTLAVYFPLSCIVVICFYS